MMAVNKESVSCKGSNNDKISFKTEEIKTGEREELSGSNIDYKPPEKKLRPMGAARRNSMSPKKRLSLPDTKDAGTSKEKIVYRFGNYNRYYGYRNTEDFHDVRLDVFHKHKELFEGKEILDIGCNNGLVTMSIAKDFSINQIYGLDIDKSLINQAKKFVQRQRREFVGTDKTGFPFNVTFVHGNYVLRDPILLEVEERYCFDLVLCLSVTKWIHLNFGDIGLKLAFKRMFRQLKAGGRLLLEPQPWSSYKRRKKLTLDIEEQFKKISFRPMDFTGYLLGKDVGFSEMFELEHPSHPVKGFQRPLQVFVKK